MSVSKKASKAYGLEISAEETKLTTNDTSGINKENKLNRQKIETVTSVKYLVSVISNESCKLEIFVCWYFEPCQPLGVISGLPRLRHSQ